MAGDLPQDIDHGRGTASIETSDRHLKGEYHISYMSQPYIIEELENKTLLTILNSIDEDYIFPDIAKLNPLTIDFEKVKAINSIGIREWIGWISKYSEIEIIIFINCSRVIIDQMNMVHDFLPANGRVDSFYVPYYSDETDETKSILVTRNVEYTDESVTQPKVTDSSGNLMDMDVLAHKYFRFLREDK